MKVVKQTKKNFLIWIIVSVLFFLLILFSFLYIFFVKDVTYRNIYSNITELSEQTATQLNLVIENQKNFVRFMIESIQSGFFNSEEEIFKRFSKDLEKYHFTRLVILDENGSGKTSDGYDVKKYPNILEFFSQNEVYLSENRPSTVSDSQVNIYSSVFKLNGKKHVLFATIQTEDYKNILTRQLFDGNGGTYLINRDGIVLIDSYGVIIENNVNFYEYLKSKSSSLKNSELHKINQMEDGIFKKEIGTLDIKFNDSTYFFHFEPVGVNDWYVVTVAPDTTISKNLSIFFLFSLGICFLFNVVILAIFLFVYRMNQKKNEKLYYIAYIDPVTELVNENYFKEQGMFFLRTLSKNKYIMALDINKFKAFNKIYDHDFCDLILKELGVSLKRTLPKNSLVSRISNDVYAILVEYNFEIQKLLNKLFDMASSLKVSDTVVSLSLSIGVYKILPDETDINDLLDKAFMARQQIKGLYDNNYFIFDASLESQLLEEQDIETNMKYALQNYEFKVFYQPKMSAKNGKLVGAEALVRWYRDGKIVSPNKFIPLFEKNKFIRKLDLYVFETVCKDIVEWQDLYQQVPKISVNVSKEHFVDESFLDDYLSLIYQYGINKDNIELEITESATSDANIVDILKNIKKNGFTVSLDDFGTGYSSLNMLQSLPVDVIKIDKSFIDGANLKIDKNIINYIVMIAVQLGVKTVVEGVETKEQLEYVKKIGCDIIQGYYYSKPINKTDFEKYLNNDK